MAAEEESYHEAEASSQKDFTFFSYGKQSLEVGCFYRGPFFFLGTFPSKFSIARTTSPILCRGSH
jgi:hypothetical protein